MSGEVEVLTNSMDISEIRKNQRVNITASKEAAFHQQTHGDVISTDKIVIGKYEVKQLLKVYEKNQKQPILQAGVIVEANINLHMITKESGSRINMFIGVETGDSEKFLKTIGDMRTEFDHKSIALELGNFNKHQQKKKDGTEGEVINLGGHKFKAIKDKFDIIALPDNDMDAEGIEFFNVIMTGMRPSGDEKSFKVVGIFNSTDKNEAEFLYSAGK